MSGVASNESSTRKLAKPIERVDSIDSMEEIVDRPIRRINSKTRGRSSSQEEISNRTATSTATNSTGVSGRIPPSISRPSSRQSHILQQTNTGGLSTASGFTTEEDAFSGRSVGSQLSPNPIPFRTASISLSEKKAASYQYSSKNTDEDDIQEVQLLVKNSSRRGSRASNRISSNDNIW
jgi:hypothetical protein